MHEAIGNFTKAHATGLPDDAEAQLIALGQKSFAPLDDYPEAKAFWWPRFLRIARWLIGWERERRPQLAAVYGEIGGKMEIPLGDNTFTLTARADRIERRHDGSYAILDYKTGSARTERQVRIGMAPQLTLEAAILKSGGFNDVPAGSVTELTYVTLKGGTPAGIPYTVDFKEGTPDSQADYARKRLTGLVAKFTDPAEAYTSLVHPMWKNAYGTYDHLARVKEWSLTGGEPELDE
jgi:ATP-dependent helicase/nuclease subunit B